MRIYLVGYMSAGKSTTSKRLAKRLGFEPFDTDRLFEERFHITANDFFNKYDQPLYRKLETQILQGTAALDNAVIATGGGTPCFNDNMEWMNQHGITVFLKISPTTAIDRLSHSKVRRPLVYNKTLEELEEYVQKNYSERMAFYEQAKLVVKGENLDIEELSNAILSLMPSASTM